MSDDVRIQLLAQARTEEEELSNRLSAVRQTLRTLETALTMETWGLTKGVPLVCNGKVYRFTVVERLWGDFAKPWVRGQLQRKDGTWGTGDRSLYRDWELKR